MRQPREFPILFTPENAQKVNLGLKTQTRRVIKPQPPPECGITYMLGNESWMPEKDRSPIRRTWEAWHGPLFEQKPERHLCGSFESIAKYQVGDRLWVRENFYLDERNRKEKAPQEVIYAAAPEWAMNHMGQIERVRYITGEIVPALEAKNSIESNRWWHQKPSIFMPRWACRTVVEVTGVRAERVSDINEEDAKAEGILEPVPVHGEWCDPKKGREGHWSYRKPFSVLWHSIHKADGPSGWAANPWVWVYEFRRIA